MTFGVQIEKEILSLYSGAGIKERFHVYIRLKTCPFREIEKYVPKRGKVLDLGCSHGILSNWLALSSMDRRVIGIDYSEEKIHIAQICRTDSDRVFFSVGDICQLNRDENYNAIVISDVLYLVPFNVQEGIIRTCYEILEPGGVLVIKEIDTIPFYKYLFNYLQETVSVKVLGITKGRQFFFRGRDEYLDICKGFGFSAQAYKVDKGYLHPHIIYVAEKQK